MNANCTCTHTPEVDAGQVLHASYCQTAAAVAAQGALPVPVGDQPQPLDDTRLAEIAARVEAASKGPWKVCEDYSDVLDGDGHQIISHFHDADGQFTAHARQDVPALLAAVAYHRYWEQVGWQKAHAYNERWVRDDARLAEERHLVARLRQELSRQGRAHKAEVERLKARVAELEQQVAAAPYTVPPEAHTQMRAALTGYFTGKPPATTDRAEEA